MAPMRGGPLLPCRYYLINAKGALIVYIFYLCRRGVYISLDIIYLNICSLSAPAQGGYIFQKGCSFCFLCRRKFHYPSSLDTGSIGFESQLPPGNFLSLWYRCQVTGEICLPSPQLMIRLGLIELGYSVQSILNFGGFTLTKAKNCFKNSMIFPLI